MSNNAKTCINGLTHWGRVTHICVGKLIIIDPDNGLKPERRQAIIWTNAGILFIERLRTNFSETLIEIQTFSLKKIRLKMSSVKCCSFRLGLNVLIDSQWKLFTILRLMSRIFIAVWGKNKMIATNENVCCKREISLPWYFWKFYFDRLRDPKLGLLLPLGFLFWLLMKTIVTFFIVIDILYR